MKHDSKDMKCFPRDNHMLHNNKLCGKDPERDLEHKKNLEERHWEERHWEERHWEERHWE